MVGAESNGQKNMMSSGGPQRPIAANGNRDQERMEDRKRRLQDPMTIVLVPRTSEGRMLANLLFPFDKVIHRLRRGAGDRIELAAVHSVLMRIDQWVERMKVLLNAFGMGHSEWQLRETARDIQEREWLATRKGAVVITPRVQDTAKLCPYIRGLDEGLLRIRMHADDLSSHRKQFEEVADLILGLHRIIGEGAALTSTDYVPRGELEKILRQTTLTKSA